MSETNDVLCVTWSLNDIKYYTLNLATELDYTNLYFILDNEQMNGYLNYNLFKKNELSKDIIIYDGIIFLRDLVKYHMGFEVKV
jgi:hypothetical protein